MPIDRDVQEDESFDAVIEIHVLEDGRQTVLHILADAHLLLVDRFDLHQFVLVFEAEQEGVVDEIEVRTLGYVGTKGFHWIEGGGEET